MKGERLSPCVGEVPEASNESEIRLVDPHFSLSPLRERAGVRGEASGAPDHPPLTPPIKGGEEEMLPSREGKGGRLPLREGKRKWFLSREGERKMLPSREEGRLLPSERRRLLSRKKREGS